ncbi:ABC transporter ATP-binding protein [Planctomyces sp. SH-PL62]|uniref:ABC transporter ATP-binding protein n=1 Tax=Planctomyces sp. SH-PL62 TaxID=1636152 RepID=UPI00078D03AE|nr:ABC transporter ATP-binding protein [Planctomyces sp. SH-PL62]AMV36662.1 Lipoprotein-releasing system ATP-binding protein LolD [Planctomyces sp. SH-PL62]
MIAAVDVHKTFQSGDEVVEALRGVTFQAPAGSCNFIVGPSGSGKSTLLYLLAALDVPTSGTIRVADHDITTMSEDERDGFRRNRVGFVYQSLNLIGNLTAVDNVLLPYIPLGITSELREKACDLLMQLGLGARLKRRPRQLSGGEQQRVAIARALIKDPVVIYADEPTGSLDRAGGTRIIQLLRDRQEAGGPTLVIVTHDRRFIGSGDNVVEIEDGRVKGVPEPSPASSAADLTT